MTQEKKVATPLISGELKKIWWLEAGKEFDSTGYAYAYSLENSSRDEGLPARDMTFTNLSEGTTLSNQPKHKFIKFSRFIIRNGLLISVEDAWPKEHLLPAIVTFKNGLHTNVRRDVENQSEIRLTASEFGEGATLRIQTGGNSVPCHDLFFLRSSRQESQAAVEKKPIIFISYCHKDKAYLDRLGISLQSLVSDGIIDTWHDGKMLGGDDFENEITAMMESAKIILLLLSPDFIASDYCSNKEVPLALKLHSESKTKCKPILLRDCDWKGKPYSNLNFIQTGGQPLCKADQPDEAYQLIIDDIKAELRRNV